MRKPSTTWIVLMPPLLNAQGIGFPSDSQTAKLYRNGIDSGVTVTVAPVDSNRGLYSCSIPLGDWTAGDVIQPVIFHTVTFTDPILGSYSGVIPIVGPAEYIDSKLVSELQDPSASTIASAVRTNLTTELGRIDNNINSRATSAGQGTLTSIVQEIADAVHNGVPLTADGLDNILIDGVSLTKALQIFAAMIAGKIITAGQSPEIFLGLDGVTPRVTITGDTAGNRSAVVYNTD